MRRRRKCEKSEGWPQKAQKWPVCGGGLPPRAHRRDGWLATVPEEMAHAGGALAQVEHGDDYGYAGLNYIENRIIAFAKRSAAEVSREGRPPCRPGWEIEGIGWRKVFSERTTRRSSLP